MAFVFNQYLSQHRWEDSEWGHYELWEKEEARFKKRRKIWIFCFLSLFLVLSSIPVILNRYPKWISRRIARELAQKISALKRDASIQRTALRIRFDQERSLHYVIERLKNCHDLTVMEVIDQGFLGSLAMQKDYAWLSPAQGLSVSVPGLIQEFCYDSLNGSSSLSKNPDILWAFGIIPVKDLSYNRIDRMALLLFLGTFGEMSFD